MLRVRDAMDRAYAEPLDIPALGRIACLSPAHLIRTFRATFGETPHHYLQRRRVERAMYLLRATDRSVTAICLDVGFTSLGTFSRTFARVVGRSPSAYRRHGSVPDVPTCFTMRWTRPSGAVANGTRENGARENGAMASGAMANRANGAGESSFGEAEAKIG
jgi:AraC-like DNA-binding protein